MQTELRGAVIVNDIIVRAKSHIMACQKRSKEEQLTIIMVACA